MRQRHRVPLAFQLRAITMYSRLFNRFGTARAKQGLELNWIAVLIKGFSKFVCDQLTSHHAQVLMAMWSYVSLCLTSEAWKPRASAAGVNDSFSHFIHLKSRISHQLGLLHHCDTKALYKTQFDPTMGIDLFNRKKLDISQMAAASVVDRSCRCSLLCFRLLRQATVTSKLTRDVHT